MKLFYYELRKLYTQKFLLLMMVLSILHAILFINMQRSGGVENHKIAEVYRDLTGSASQVITELEEQCTLLEIDFMQDAVDSETILMRYGQDMIAKYAEEGCTLRYCKDSLEEYTLLTLVKSQINEISEYPGYLKHLQESAKLYSISALFGTSDSFSYRNIQDTARRYESLSDLKLPITCGIGVACALGSRYTDIFALILLVAAAMLMVFNERETGMETLICIQKRGQAATYLAKCTVLLLHSIIITFLLVGWNIFFAAVVYGFGDLSRPIQSVPSFLYSALEWSVGKTVLSWLLAKLSVYVMFGLMAFWISIRFRQIAVVPVLFAGALGIGFFLRRILEPYGLFSVLISINPITFLQTEQFFQTFENCNFFGYPISRSMVCLTAGVLLIVVVFGDGMHQYCYAKKQSIQDIKTICIRQRVVVNLFQQELFIILRLHHVAWLFILFSCIQAVQYTTINIPLTKEDLYFRAYMEVLQGEWTPEKQHYIDKEDQQLQQAHFKLNQLRKQLEAEDLTQIEFDMQSTIYQKILDRNEALTRVQMQADHAAAGKSEFIYDTGLNFLTDTVGNRREKNHLLLCAAMLLFIIVPTKCRAYESGMDTLIRTTIRGQRNRMHIQNCIFMLLSIPCMMLTWLPDYIYVGMQFGWKSIFAPVQSLNHLSDFSVHCSILSFFGIQFMVRLMIMASISLLLSILSDQMKKTIPTMAIAAIPILMFVLL